MQPDITAPGVNILAAYSPTSPTAVPGESMEYYFMSGTSMSCPHVAGVAAYIKTFHPHWSASAVKSAIMTTAWAMNASKNAEAEFAYGSGHVNPTVAVDPGLVYDIAKEDYLNMLCSLDYSVNGISTLAGGAFTCSKESKLNVRDLNYPSMTAKVSASSSSDITFSRTVTNVGENGSTYKAKLAGDPKLNIKVDPETLSFKSSGEKKSFTVTVSGKSLASISGIVSASLIWSDGSHNVRSPIVVNQEPFSTIDVDHGNVRFSSFPRMPGISNRLRHQGRETSSDHKKPPTALTIAHPENRKQAQSRQSTTIQDTKEKSTALNPTPLTSAETKTEAYCSKQNGEPLFLLYALPFFQRAEGTPCKTLRADSTRHELTNPVSRLHHPAKLRRSRSFSAAKASPASFQRQSNGQDKESEESIREAKVKQAIKGGGKPSDVGTRAHAPPCRR
ncbi:hypothetical protein N665_0472s0011 [Sinapis alba]|nr:hypothetical protein N665_0472s0011 [Sinapis alba]